MSDPRQLHVSETARLLVEFFDAAGVPCEAPRDVTVTTSDAAVAIADGYAVGSVIVLGEGLGAATISVVTADPPLSASIDVSVVPGPPARLNLRWADQAVANSFAPWPLPAHNAVYARIDAPAELV